VAGQVMATPALMAPEQARGEALTPAADIHALGAVLFGLRTGKVPCDGTSAPKVLTKAIQGHAPDAAGVPRAAAPVYLKAMARVPQASYATGAELARDVERRLPGPQTEHSWGPPLVLSGMVGLSLGTPAGGLRSDRNEESGRVPSAALCAGGRGTPSIEATGASRTGPFPAHPIPRTDWHG
jgi:serine/threonine-protein kinase